MKIRCGHYLLDSDTIYYVKISGRKNRMIVKPIEECAFPNVGISYGKPSVKYHVYKHRYGELQSCMFVRTTINEAITEVQTYPDGEKIEIKCDSQFEL